MGVVTFFIGSDDIRRYSMTDGIRRPAEEPLPLAVAQDLSRYDPIWKNRAEAIQSYATLESALCSLLRALTGVTWPACAAIFYKITDSRARLEIIEKILHQKCGPKYNLFWNDLKKHVQQLDLRRNCIVHWLAVANCHTSNDQTILVGVTLVPPASVYAGKSEEHLTSDDLIKFAHKCDDFARMATTLSIVIDPPEGSTIGGEGEPWPDICQQPIVYPIPEGHPLFPTQPRLEIHPQSFPASLQFLRLAEDQANMLKKWNP